MLGGDAELSFEDSDAALVHPQGTCSVLVQRVETHQPAIGALVERVEREPLLTALDGRAVIAGLLEKTGQPLEQPLGEWRSIDHGPA